MKKMEEKMEVSNTLKKRDGGDTLVVLLNPLRSMQKEIDAISMQFLFASLKGTTHPSSQRCYTLRQR